MKTQSPTATADTTTQPPTAKKRAVPKKEKRTNALATFEDEILHTIILPKIMAILQGERDIAGLGDIRAEFLRQHKCRVSVNTLSEWMHKLGIGMARKVVFTTPFTAPVGGRLNGDPFIDDEDDAGEMEDLPQVSRHTTPMNKDMFDLLK